MRNKDEEIKKEVSWDWEVYKALGYRITEDEAETKVFHEFIENIIQKTRQQEREKVLHFLKSSLIQNKESINKIQLLRENKLNEGKSIIAFLIDYHNNEINEIIRKIKEIEK